MAKWRMRIPKTIALEEDAGDAWVIIGDGVAPMAEMVMAPPPPLQPPIGTTLPPEVVDTSPFVWPPQPGYRPYKPDERYAALGEGFYAGSTQYGNPQPGANLWAGTILAGHVGGWDLAGWDLWAPRDAKGEMIRRALKTGRPS